MSNDLICRQRAVAERLRDPGDLQTLQSISRLAARFGG